MEFGPASCYESALGLIDTEPVLIPELITGQSGQRQPKCATLAQPFVTMSKTAF